jgi:thiamine biosynthesis lipoprotein
VALPTDNAASINTPPGTVHLEPRGETLLAAVFAAMASPCEVLLPRMAHDKALEIGQFVAAETWRIEKKFSRYRDDSVLAWIHRNRGREITVDAETASLLDFARQCHEMSGGSFDVSSGVLRHAWRFDGSTGLPTEETIARLLPLVGFEKIAWQAPRLLLPADMEIDFGGIGKEYAVDRAYEQVAAVFYEPFLINLGGDLRANRPPAEGPWQIGIERPDTDRDAALLLTLERGALATSGDSHRCIVEDGKRYGHILDPRTGRPVAGAPRSVTVAASSCTEAGLLATLALLNGAGARSFLEEQNVRHWILE